MHQPIQTSLLSDQRGLTTVEYVIVLCLIASVAVGLWQKFGSNVEGYLQGAIDDIDGEMKKSP
jgi:Flp pilus assembly pilin Flp